MISKKLSAISFQLSARGAPRPAAFWPFGFSAFAWLPGCLVVFCLSAARADEITTRTEHYRKIKIVNYADGRIRFRQPAGDLVEVSILEVRALLVDTVGNVSDLNQAELYVDKGEPSQAVLRYERALRSTQEFWQDLARVRLLQACDRAGYLDKAVAAWLAVLRREPALAAELLPSAIPPTRTPAINRALSNLEVALAKTTDETGRRLIEFLRFSIHRRLGDALADEWVEQVALAPLTGPIATGAAYAIKTEALRRLFQMQRIRQVLTGVDAALEDCPEVSMPDLLLLKGEVLFATARERADYLRSGWAFLRVPIHFPKDPRAARGLLGAARVHEKIGAPEPAVKLLRECLALESADVETRKAATEALRRLTERPGS